MSRALNLLNKVKLYQGQTKVLDLTVKTKDGKQASLQGATIYFTVKQKIDDTTPVIALSTPSSSGIEITNAPCGLATITISSEDSDISPGCYYFDVIVEYAGTPLIRYPVVKKSELIVEAAVKDFS